MTNTEIAPALNAGQVKEFLARLLADERAVADALAHVSTNSELHVGEVVAFEELTELRVQFRDHDQVGAGQYDSGTYTVTVHPTA